MTETTMNAVCLNAPNVLEYKKITKPIAGSFEVLCKVESVAICGTDPHIIEGDFPGFWPKQFPLVPGHEWAGTIVELGEKTESLGWSIGDRVSGISHVGCGICSMCMEGRYNLCLNYGHEELGHRQYGHYSQGAYADFMCTNIKAITKIPDSMDFNLAACLDPLSIALHMVMRAKIQPGDSVLINGAGAQGLMSILCARSLGAGQIMISGSGHRLKVAESMGARPIDYRKEKVAERVMELTGGMGAKRVVECSGTPLGIQQACAAVAKGGTISVVSLPKDDVALPVRKIVLDEIDFVGNRANPNTLKKAITLAANYESELKSLITHEFALSAFRDAMDVFIGRKDNSLKVIMKPGK